MATPHGLNSRNHQSDTPEVDEAERKVGAVLGDLEDSTDSEVKNIKVEEVVDTDSQGRPVVKKSVDIQVAHRPKKGWAR